MKNKKNRFLGLLLALLMLPMLIVNLASCGERILSFKDLQTMGFASMKGAGIGYKNAPQIDATIKKKKGSNSKNVQTLLTMREDDVVEEAELVDEDGNEEEINLHLYRYSRFGNYAVLVYTQKDMGKIYSYYDIHYHNVGHWYRFIYSFMTGKLYYFDVERITEVDTFCSFQNHITARAMYGNCEGYTLLFMTETNEGLIVEDYNTLYNLLYQDERVTDHGQLFGSKIGRDGNFLFGGFVFKKYDGSFKKFNMECGQLVDGRFAAVNRNDEGQLVYYLLDKDLNMTPYTGEEELVFRYSPSLHSFLYDYMAIDFSQFAEIIYETSTDIYYKINTTELHHISIDGDNFNDEIISEYASLSKYYLYGDKLVFLDIGCGKIKEYDMTLGEVNELYQIDLSKGPSCWQYGPEGYMYIKYEVAHYGEGSAYLGADVTTGIFVNDQYIEVDYDESYFDYEIAPTIFEDFDDLIQSVNQNNQQMHVKTLKSMR